MDSTLDALDNITRLALAASDWQARAEAAELELSQERFMRQAAEAEVERLREQVAALRSALEIAAMYVARALADGAYGNSVVASRALDKINSALDATDNSGQDAQGG